MLFNTTIFGPIHSRRLGNSLGINLLPNNGKICSFDCIYCECGLNKDGREDTKLPSRKDVYKELEAKLIEYKATNSMPIDTFTFAGNGEPTMHPDFRNIVDDVIHLRNTYYPEAAISVLTNAWQLDNKDVVFALKKVDNNILKLDSAIKETILKINQPVNPNFEVENLISQISQFKDNCIVQTMFIKGEGVDNTTEEEITEWINALKIIQPRLVQIYSIDRKVPIEGLKHVDEKELREIEKRVKKIGLNTLVTP